MPGGGSKKGERRGAAKPGARGPNKVTVEAALIAERQLETSKQRGQPLAKEVLDGFMQLFAGLATRYQPTPPPGAGPEWWQANKPSAEFEKWSMLACKAAAMLAPYQSPTFKAIAIAPAPGSLAAEMGASGPVLDGQTNVVSLPKDPISASRLYLKLIGGPVLGTGATPLKKKSASGTS